jgi:hypothetical protein
MVWEDVHWSDPTTRESLDLIIDRVPTLRVLVMLTFRPEFMPPWIGRPHVTMLMLNRLPRQQRAEMIAYVTGGKALPKEISDQIVDRTDGVPLFIEELTKTVVESGIIIEAGDHYAMNAPGAPLAIPTTLHGSLLARLDRLAPTRELAQIGAALGRQFSYELIRAVAQMPQQQLDESLTQLVRAELVFQHGTPPEAEYTFKHALVQDAAYDTLLRSRRQQLHGRIAATMEREFPEIVEMQPQLDVVLREGLLEQRTPKALMYRNDLHETLISASLTWGIGGSGARGVGANKPNTLIPSITLGKGFGVLPDELAWLRPFAITGAFAVEFPTSPTSVNFGADPATGQFGPMLSTNSGIAHWGFAIEYSTLYLTSRFTPGQLPKEEPLHQFVPLVEFAFDSPVAERTAATMNPGISYVKDVWQISVEAIVPLNSQGGHGLGVRTQLLLFLDDLAPSLFGKPLLRQ